MIDPTDEGYHAWWPAAHKQFHIVKHAGAGSHLGDLIYMNEFVGRYHLAMNMQVVADEPNKKIVWQAKQGILMPVWLSLIFDQHGPDLRLTHIVSAGFKAIPGGLLDPVIRLFFTNDMQQAIGDHAKMEFPMLAARVS